MAITTMDALVDALATAELGRLNKRSVSTEGATTYHSLWKVAGLPGAGATPASGNGAVPTSATAGAIPFTNPAGGDKKYLLMAAMASSLAQTFIIYDRLWHNSGFVTNSVANQDIGTPPTLTRPDANGADVELWGEVYAAPGATGATWTVTYVDQDGNTGNSATYTHPANAETVGQMFPFNLAAGDTGVRSVSRFVCSISSGTAGDIGLVLLRRVAEISIPVAGSGRVKDAFQLGMPEIYADACLAVMEYGGGSSGEVDLTLRIGDG